MCAGRTQSVGNLRLVFPDRVVRSSSQSSLFPFRAPESFEGGFSAHPSTSFAQKRCFRVEGVHLRPSPDAHPPRENLVFTEKLWKGVPKSTPGSILGRFWHSAQTWLDRGGTWLDRGVRSRPDRPRNAIAQPDRPEIDRKKLHRPARSTSTSSEQLSSTTNSTI